MDVLSWKKESLSKLHVADHLFNTTFPIVHEPKLLLSVIESLDFAYDYAMQCLLAHEQNTVHIPVVHTFEERFELFVKIIIRKYAISNHVAEHISYIHSIVVDYKKSAVSFRRKGSYVLSSSDYDLTLLRPENIKEHVRQSKQNLELLFSYVTSKYDAE